MKHYKILSASRLMMMVLACTMMTMTSSCGGDDSTEGSGGSGGGLSQETTPIEFKFNRGNNILFDYAGNSYICSDTTDLYKRIVNLRQGRHHLVWITGLNTYEPSASTQAKTGQKYDEGAHYDPLSKTVTDYSMESTHFGVDKVQVFEQDMEVTPYLTTVQQVKYTTYMTASIAVKITDYHKSLTLPEKTGFSYSTPSIGKLTGIPYVSSLTLGGSHSLRQNQVPLNIMTAVDAKYIYSPLALTEGLYVLVQGRTMLCPPGGLSDIRPVAEVTDANGSRLTTTTLPEFSLKPGYTTVLEGPLFSGSASDWKVTQEPYE